MADEENQETGKGLRAQLEAALAKNAELESQLEAGTSAQRELAFLKAGVDTSEGVGKLIAKSYDGELDPEEIVAYAEEYGYTPASREAPPEEEQQQQRVTQLRQGSEPEGAGKRMSHTEWMELSKSDPAAAVQAHQQGLVDIPPHIASSLSAR